MAQTDNPINSINIHLGDLLEGTVSAWGVVAEVTVIKDEVEALVVPAAVSYTHLTLPTILLV